MVGASTTIRSASASAASAGIMASQPSWVLRSPRLAWRTASVRCSGVPRTSRKEPMISSTVPLATTLPRLRMTR